MTKFFKIFSISIVLLFSFLGFSNAEEEVIINFFDDRLCPVCASAKNFIQEIQSDYPEIQLNIYSITNTKKLAEVVQEHNIEGYRIMAPTIFINDVFFQFRDFTSREEKMIIQAIKGEKIERDCCIFRIPFLNIEVDISRFSLFFITFVLGSIDGFNVCSVGALILVLSIVLVLNSKKKIFFFGGLFILTTVIIYGSLVFIWGKLFELLVGKLEILRIIVGLAALGGGIYFFKEFWRFFKYGPTCQASNSQLAKKATSRLKQVFEQPGNKIYLLSASVMFFATIITLVELPCSIGIPVAYSGILIESGISLFSYIFYILLYLFFYMLIEIIVFTGAVLTKKIWFANSKTITWITFLGSMVLFYLALHYLIGI
jgi:glutaredoxin